MLAQALELSWIKARNGLHYSAFLHLRLERILFLIQVHGIVESKHMQCGSSHSRSRSAGVFLGRHPRAEIDLWLCTTRVVVG